MNGKFEFMVIAMLGLPVVCHGETDRCIDKPDHARFASAAAAPALEREIDALRGIDAFQAQVNYAVSLPMADDDVVYTVDISAEKAEADSLLGYSYMIDWSLPTPTGTAAGFSSYFDGHLYSYRDHRLREYHYKWDSLPFQTQEGGVQRNTQFSSLFPFALADKLAEIASDSTYTVSIAAGSAEERKARVVKVVREINSQECLRQEYYFADSDGMPIKISSLYNPGMLGEQEVTAVYSYPAHAEPQVARSEEQLIERFPEIFDRYRESNYSIENMRGIPLPGFALPTTTGERYTYSKGDAFPSPVIVAVIDPAVSSAASTVTSLRSVVEKLPRQTGLILMFPSSDIDAIEELTGQLRQGEAHLVSARPFVRDSGITAYPTVILADSDGKVSEVIIGTSATLADDLLQAAALLR